MSGSNKKRRTINSPTANPMVDRTQARMHEPSSRQSDSVGLHGGQQGRECSLDRTLSETFPCSDPLSSIPDPQLC